MDLSRIEAWTREKLEAEAARRGIRSPQFRTRAELVRLLLRDQYGEQLAAGRELVAQGVRSMAQARGLLQSAMSAAISALPEPFDALARLRARLPGSERARDSAHVRSPTSAGMRAAPAPAATPAAAPPEPRAPGAEPQAQAGADAEHDPATERGQSERAERPAAADASSLPRAEPLEAIRPQVASGDLEPTGTLEPSVASADASEAVSDWDGPPALGDPLAAHASSSSPSVPPLRGLWARTAGRADDEAAPRRMSSVPPSMSLAMSPVARADAPGPHASVPTTRSFVEEPIRTRSMARLLAAQGHRERALAIYRELLALDPEEPELEQEADAVRAGAEVPLPSASSLPSGRGLEQHLPPADEADRLWCEGEPHLGLRLRWQLGGQGQHRARAVLGSDGELAIRLVSIAPDPVRVVRSEITEHGPIDPSGEWTAPALAGSARCFAAIGLRDGERFVAVVHVHSESALGDEQAAGAR